MTATTGPIDATRLTLDERLAAYERRLDEQAALVTKQGTELDRLRRAIPVNSPPAHGGPSGTELDVRTSRRRALQLIALAGAGAGAVAAFPGSAAAGDQPLPIEVGPRTEAPPPSTAGVRYFTVTGQSLKPRESATTYEDPQNGGIRPLAGTGQIYEYNVRLPDGATLVSADFYYRDISALDFSFNIYRYDHSVDAFFTVASGTSTGNAVGVRVTTITPGAATVIDNNAFSYVLAVTFSEVLTQTLLGIRVGYRPPVLNVDSSGPAGTVLAAAHNVGDVVRSDDGDLWYCAASGTPGALRKLGGAATSGQLHLLPAPIRVYDSRPGNAPIVGADGPLANAVRTVDLSSGFIGGVASSACPVGASGALLSLTIANTTGSGFLALFSNAVADVSSSVTNWYQNGQAIGVTTVSAVDSASKVKVKAGGPGATDFIIDVMGYYR